MASTHIWHQLHLYGVKRLTLFLVFNLGILVSVAAQNFSVKKNLPNHDDKPMHYGFYLGVNSSRFVLNHSNYYIQRQRDSMTVNPKFSPGFTIGFVLNKRLSDFVDVRFVPGVGFYSRVTEFKTAAATTDLALGATSLEFPLLMKFKSLRRGNIRVYFVGGAKAAVDIGNKKRAALSEQLEVVSEDFTIEYGVGLDLFYPYFKFAPELRFSNGLYNRFAPGNNPYSKSVQRVSSNTVTLYFNFES